MQKRSVLTCICVLCFTASGAVAQEVVWTLEALQTPESVYYDAGRDVLYVSNIAGKPTAKDGNGHISRVSLDGAMLEAEWVTGLDAPKGLVSDGETLFVSDIDKLVAIDIATGTVTAAYPADGAIFLNDPAIDTAGRVYVSDMITNKIHVLEGDTLGVLVEGDALQHPNGLNMRGDQLLVAPWGKDLQPDFTTTTGGHLYTVDLDSAEIAPLGSGAPIGNLDGLEPDGAGNWIVSDWIAGAVVRIAEDGGHETLLDLDMGSADIEFLPEKSLLIVPMMLNDTLVAYRLD